MKFTFALLALAAATRYPTRYPTTKYPTGYPTTRYPTGYPTRYPTRYPTTPYPTGYPTTKYPTGYPTRYPTRFPTRFPTGYPTTGYPTHYPTHFPTAYPTTPYPTGFPTPAYPHDAGAGNDHGMKDHEKDFFNQQTETPTKQPTADFLDHKNADGQGDLAKYDDQNDRIQTPTAKPTSFPTKDQASNKGSVCKFTEGSLSFTKPVGWVGAGPGKYYCNVWRCEPSKTTFTTGTTGVFKAARRTCNISYKNLQFCSHTKCEIQTTQDGRKIIAVQSHHLETVGGKHICGFAKHMGPNGVLPSGRPACDCVCHGARKQDAPGFIRSMNEISRNVVVNRANNHNNWYSQHNNLATYSEKDQSYNGEKVSHGHINK